MSNAPIYDGQTGASGLAHSPAVGEFAVQRMATVDAENARLRNKIKYLEDALKDAQHSLTLSAEYFDELADVNDGDEGRQVANTEMRLGMECNDTLDRVKTALAI